MKTHGLTKHRLFNTWNSMMARCHGKNNKRYKVYGDRGIEVHQDWHNVKTFIDDMYPSYIEGLSIDRINNDLGYSKDNCRWVSDNIQSRNRRLLQVNNKTGYRGVGFLKSRNKFRARISVNYKEIHLGYFKTALEAAKAYDNYIIDNNLEHTKNLS